MADEATTDNALDEQSDVQDTEGDISSGKKGILSKILLGFLGLLIFIGASVGISTLVYHLKEKPSNEDAIFKTENEYEEYQQILSYDFGQDQFSITLNPKEGQSKPVIVQAKLALTYGKEQEKLGQALADRKDQMMDIIQGIIARKDPDDLRNIMYREENLSVEILAALNPLFGGEFQILGVYMPKFDVIEGKE